MNFTGIEDRGVSLHDCSRRSQPTNTYTIPMPDCEIKTTQAESKHLRVSIYSPIINPALVRGSLCKRLHIQVNTFENFLKVKEVNSMVKEWKIPDEKKCESLKKTSKPEDHSDLDGYKQYGTITIRYNWLSHETTEAEIYYIGNFTLTADLHSGKLLSPSGHNDECQYRAGRCSLGTHGIFTWTPEKETEEILRCPVEKKETAYCIGRHEKGYITITCDDLKTTYNLGNSETLDDNAYCRASRSDLFRSNEGSLLAFDLSKTDPAGLYSLHSDPATFLQRYTSERIEC